MPRLLLIHQDRHRLRGPSHHRQRDLRQRNPYPRLRRGPRRPAQRPQHRPARHPQRHRHGLLEPGHRPVHARLTFDEPFAHRLYAGADMLTVPSRFEPCGLAQLNAMRYGTIPIVRRTGGLAETVVDTTRATTAARTATGFQFDVDTPAALAQTLRRAHTHYRQRDAWARLIHNAMHRDSSWTRSARTWLDLYAEATTDRVAHLPPA